MENVKVLLKQDFYVDEIKRDKIDKETKIEVEVIETTCEACGKKKISVFVNNRIVYGAIHHSYENGKWILNCGCLSFKNLE